MFSFPHGLPRFPSYREPDHVDESDKVRPLDRVPVGHLEDAVAEEPDPRGPVVIEQGLGDGCGGGVIVLGHDRRQPEDRGDGRPRLPQPHGGLRIGQMDRLVDDGHLGRFVAARSPPPPP